MISHHVSVEVFAYGSHVGGTKALHFATNNDALAIQNGSVAAFCPFCGEVWLRAVHAHGFPFWRCTTVPCHAHVRETSRFSPIWMNLASVYSVYPDTDEALLRFELEWWAQKYDNWGGEITILPPV